MLSDEIKLIAFGTCVMCGDKTAKGIEYWAPPPFAMNGGAMTFFYCGCWGDAETAWPQIYWAIQEGLKSFDRVITSIGVDDERK